MEFQYRQKLNVEFIHVLELYETIKQTALQILIIVDPMERNVFIQ